MKIFHLGILIAGLFSNGIHSALAYPAACELKLEEKLCEISSVPDQWPGVELKCDSVDAQITENKK